MRSVCEQRPLTIFSALARLRSSSESLPDSLLECRLRFLSFLCFLSLLLCFSLPMATGARGLRTGRYSSTARSRAGYCSVHGCRWPCQHAGPGEHALGTWAVKGDSTIKGYRQTKDTANHIQAQFRAAELAARLLAGGISDAASSPAWHLPGPTRPEGRRALVQRHDQSSACPSDTLQSVPSPQHAEEVFTHQHPRHSREPLLCKRSPHYLIEVLSAVEGPA